VGSQSNLFNNLSAEKGLVLEIAPFTVRVQSSITSFIKTFSQLYSCYPLKADDGFFSDFHIQIEKPLGLRRWLKPQVKFYFDGVAPFTPLPISQAFPSFEWGLNWCVANHSYQYLIIHAAVVEKNGFAMILPGNPGAGKSTLCAALVTRGWRLLSDEMAIIDLKTNELIPLVRPVSLKNESIDIIKGFSSDAFFGDRFLDTSKGVVAHMKAPMESVLSAKLRAKAAWVIFPQYVSGASTSFIEINKSKTVIELAKNSFNYNALGKKGFDSLCDVVQNSACFELKYSCLENVISMFDDLADNKLNA